MAASKFQIPLKVMIHKEEERVVFAEANNDFVDILFSFLTMPMGTIVRLLSKQSQPPVIGSFNNLYISIANLDVKYFTSEVYKYMLLHKPNLVEVMCQQLRINIDDTLQIYEGKRPVFMRCGSHIVCKHCLQVLGRKAVSATYVITKPTTQPITTDGVEGVFVSPTASYVITDDLRVIPDILTSTLKLVENTALPDFGVLKEMTFKIGPTEILDLLRHSIMSESPLTSMFLRKNHIMKDKSVKSTNCQTSTETIIWVKKMRVKVLVQKSTNKILLAYSSEDFINFLFKFVIVPLGRVLKLRNEIGPALGVENIYQSALDLDVAEYYISQQMKDVVLNPEEGMKCLCSNKYIPLREDIFYWSGQLSLRYGTRSGFSVTTNSISSKGAGEYIKKSTRYMVTDDLVVAPMSSMSSIKYLQTWKIPPSDTDEQEIDIGNEEAINLLKATLVSTSVLTDGLKHLIKKTELCTTAKKPIQRK